ncbi:MAG: hypothetical protein KKC80_07670 [Candidatus Margulisbacteria bacterium]|nr:hypothetical protein [Candidatus Margulisiibacteriota bacterium]MBU1617229.1 hypothetical protein [Candidatus Margulisiibacteriota bacterium]MBU1867188.1 hypothetical protein [Candidatus Margulisiibacteriota bacterium]
MLITRPQISLIVQNSYGHPITQAHRIDLPGKRPDQLPELSLLSPPARLSNSIADFRRHRRFMTDCLEATTGTIPLLVTDQHLYSLPFYKALAGTYPDQDIAIVTLDNHLDGVDLTYTNWAFWGFGIYLNHIKPTNLFIIGSGQQIKAEAFAREHKCEAAGALFNYQVIEEFSEFTRRAADNVAAVNPSINIREIRRDRRLRDFAEYSLLKNAGVTISQSLTGVYLAGKPVFVSFDTDVPLRGEKLLEIARLLRGSILLGLHISELSQGLPIHGREEIETLVKMIVE